MKNGLAIWHYPHRTLFENIEYFAAQGYDSVSLLGDHFVKAIRTEGEKLAQTLKKANVIVTVHHKLPVAHDEAVVEKFMADILDIGAWQKQYGLIAVLSFDVWNIRDNITPYLDFVMLKVEECKIAVEDFGLTEDERRQIEHLKGNERFAYLIDIGHMFIRLRGKPTEPYALFRHTDDEGLVCDHPGYEEFKKAFSSKAFPICEIHLHNNDGYTDTHQFLENGTLDISAIAKLMNELQFDGVITIESAPGFAFECKGQAADDGIAKTFAYWKDCLAKA